MKRLSRAACAALLLWTGCAAAHKPSDSYLSLALQPGDAALAGRWDIALRDLEQAIGLDTNGDGVITWGELRLRERAVSAYALARLHLDADGSPCALRYGDLLIDEHVDGRYAVLRFAGQCPARITRLQVGYSLLFDIDPSHRGLLEVRSPAGEQAAVLGSSDPVVQIEVSGVDAWRQAAQFVREGIWHIWTGYDHILFLITLLLTAVLRRQVHDWVPAAGLRESLLDVLGIVSAFTLSHSLTLSLAVLGIVHLPSRLVESGIALTVLLGALNNLHPLVTRRRWLIALLFGLVHGLGFASVLRDIDLSRSTLALALVSFNLGVEAGQAVIVLVVVPGIHALRTMAFYRRIFLPAASFGTMAIASVWLAQRAL